MPGIPRLQVEGIYFLEAFAAVDWSSLNNDPKQSMQVSLCGLLDVRMNRGDVRSRI